MISLLPLILVASTSATDPRVAAWQMRAQAHEAASEWCEALFYRGHALAVARDDATRYRAFLDAYAADQLRTAHALSRELHIDALGLDEDGARRVALILADLETLAVLEDAPCTHAPVCGDGIVEGNEMCDAADAGCTSQCKVIVELPRVGLATPAAKVEAHAEKAPRSAALSTAPGSTAPRSAPHATEGITRDANDALMITGAALGGAGFISFATGAVLALRSDRTIADPSSLGGQKRDAEAQRTGSWWAMGIGSVVAVAGAIAFGVGREEAPAEPEHAEARDARDARDAIDASDAIDARDAQKIALHSGRRR